MSTLFYRNPRLLLLSIALIVVSGMFAYQLLPRLEDPELSERFALIKTIFPSASPERVESLVTDKIEEALQEIEEIKTLESTSSVGFSMILVELNDEVGYNETAEIWSRARDKIGDVTPELPSEAQLPLFEVINTQAFSLIVGLTWELESDPRYGLMSRLVEDLEDRLRAIPGTKDLEYFGNPKEEVLVEIDQTQLSAIGLTPSQLSGLIRQSDAKVSAGQLRSGTEDLLIEPNTELQSLDQIRQIPVQVGDQGDLIYLSDVAEVQKGIVEPVSSRAFVDGKHSVTLAAYLEPTQRIDTWAEKARTVIREYESGLPAGIGLVTLFDQSRYTAERLSSLLRNLMMGASAVVLVIFLMMGWRSALLVGLALPLSSLMVLSGMRYFNIPIHQMSVTGLIIALGLLIDNAIVVVDEMNRRIDEGETPLEAIRLTFSHLIVPLLGSTLTTTFAFMPIALMPGPAGEFVGSIALSVILALFSSLFVSLTIIPALNGVLHRDRDAKSRWWWIRGIRTPRAAALFHKFLDFCFQRPLVGIGLSVLIPVLGFSVFSQLPEQFFPPADRDQFHIEFELSPHASLHQTEQIVLELREELLTHPKIENVHWFLGQNAPIFYYNLMQNRENQSRFAHALVQLDSPLGATELIHELQDELDQRYPDSRILVRQLEQGPPFDAPLEYRIYGSDVQKLRELGDDVRQIMASTPEVLHTRAMTSEVLPKLGLNIDEEEARYLGLNHSAIAGHLNATLEGVSGGSILETTEELPVRVRVSGEKRADLEKIVAINLPSTNSNTAEDSASQKVEKGTIPLSVVAETHLVPESAGITRRNGQRLNTVQGFITAGVLPAIVLEDFRQKLEQSDFKLPPGYQVEIGGESAERDNAVGNLMSSVGMLMILMIATLVLSFNSFRLASLILAIAVLSIGPGIGALWVGGYPFGFMAIVGIMGLIGIAINDSIVVLAAIRGDEQARNGEVRAITSIVLEETRHVVATTITTIAGFIPLLVQGGGFWPPLALAISGGVAAATVMALFFIPSSYLLMTRLMPGRLCEKLCNAGTNKEVIEVPERVELAS